MKANAVEEQAMGQRAIITGTGPQPFSEWPVRQQQQPLTAFGKPTAAVSLVGDAHRALWRLPRHGEQHQFPPHAIDYRSNLAALKSLGVTEIIALFAVGAIADDLQPGDLLLPDQLIDYSSGREQTIFNGPDVRHVDFREPFTPILRQHLLQLAQAQKIPVCPTATYAVAQGPRYETRAELARMARDGCHIVGMTAMPEAALAREMELAYASIAVVMNTTSAQANPYNTTDCEAALAKGMAQTERLLLAWLQTDLE
ncbi:MAG TPA: S-methyl-5'-thioinosine phosphorylase [Permianibacter sp.]|nr:S-methyl-5'-thioinosine phosphorylase [Permianibacter sp.]